MSKTKQFTKLELALFNELNPLFNKQQMEIINRKTPDSETEIVKINGKDFKQVKIEYAKSILMLVTGANYDEDVLSEDIYNNPYEASALVKLTIRSNGQTAYRTQRGKFGMNRGYSRGEAQKAAITNALRKCMYEFGFFNDLRQEEIKEPEPEKEIEYPKSKKLERLDHFLSEAISEDEVKTVYDKFLETEKEDENSLKLLEKHIKRVLK